MTRATAARRTATIALAVSLGAAGCAIETDAVPRDIPSDRLVDADDEPTGDVAAGTSRIYLLTPPGDDQRRQLRSVSRAVGDDSDDLLTSLFAGPNEDEIERQLGTAIPSGLAVIDTRTVGRVLTVDVAGEAFSDLSVETLTLALAQIVATASELDGIRRVRLRTDGQVRAWPTGDGELSQNPLSIFDYPGVLETTQPAFPAAG